MRGFLKLVVSILVIAVISYTVYFLLYNNSKYHQNQIEAEGVISKEPTQNDIEIDTNTEVDDANNEEDGEEDKDSNLIDNPIKSGDDFEVNEDGIEFVSGDIEEKISKINLIETKNNLSNLAKSLEDSLGADIMGTKNQDYFDSFDMTEMAVTVQVAGSMIYIIPFPDLVDNAQYHYDKDGNLVLYICELIGVGGEVRYYFENGIPLTQETNVEEDIPINYESTNEIIERSKLIYDKYMK